MLDKKNIIITGVSSGIGESLSRFFVKQNAKVIGIARNEEKLNSIKNELGDNFEFIVKDLSSDIENHSKIVDYVFENYGKIDGIILNAGVQETKPLAVVKYESSKNIFDINYFANIFIIKGLKKKYVGSEGTSIVAISSITSQLGIAGLTNYSASKAALESAVRTLSVEIERYNIRINGISLGHVETDILIDKSLGNSYFEKLNMIYSNGLISKNDVNELVAFLISSISSKINGSIIKLDSGVSNKFGL
jgi:NAD(P)-dependent dehydrogenase (short-subunit alcohol dehydrogenase family)